MDSNLILGSAEIRRKFIDILICQFDKIYLNHLINYKRLIKQRNILLNNFLKKYFSNDDIEIYNDQLIVSGNYIFKKRKEIINLLKDKILGYYNSLLSYNENIDIVYKSQLSENSFSDLLNKNIEKDKILCYTSSGIHRDDIDFFINGLSMKKQAHGQQKIIYFIS